VTASQCPSTYVDPQDRLRLSQGAFFKYVDSVKVITDQWSHTFLIRLPELNIAATNIPHVLCKREVLDPLWALRNTTRRPKERAKCGETGALAHLLQDVYADYRQKITEIVQLMYSLFPNTTMATNKQYKRALFGIVSDATRYLFGIASVSDIAEAEQNMKKLIKDRHLVEDELHHRMIDLASAVRITNDRLTDAILNVEEQRDMIQNITVETRHTMWSLAWATNLLFKKIHASIFVYAEFTAHLRALENLVKGKLDPGLINPAEMDKMLSAVAKAIEAKHPGFVLVTRSSAYYYAKAKVLTIRSNSTLYVHIFIPISAWLEKFDVYEVNIFKLPIQHNTTHVTWITNVPKFIAIRRDKVVAFEFSQKPEITDHMLEATGLTLTTHHQSCVLALFNDDTNKIHELCDVGFQREGLKPQLISLSAASILLVDIQEYTLFLPNRTQQKFPGCQFCLKKLQCGVSMRAGDSIVPPKISHCSDDFDNETVYSFNAPIIKNFFSEADANIFKTIRYLDQELKLDLPAMEFAKVKQGAHTEYDKQATLNLSKVVEKIHLGEKIYEAQSSVFERDMVDFSFHILDMYKLTDWIVFVLVGSNIFFIILFIWTHVKIRHLATIIAVTQSIPLIETASLNASLDTVINKLVHLRFNDKLMSEAVLDLSNITMQADIVLNLLGKQIVYIETACIITITIALILIAVKLQEHMAWKTRVKFGCQLCFNISKGHKRLTIMGQCLSDSFDNYRWMDASNIQEVAVIGRWNPKMKLIWPAKLQHRGNNHEVSFSKYCKLSWTEAKQLRHILKSIKYDLIVVPFFKNEDTVCYRIARNKPERKMETTFMGPSNMEQALTCNENVGSLYPKLIED